MSSFKPPIEERTTNQLLEIVAAPRNWDDLAVKLAAAELERRNVPEERIKHTEYLLRKAEQIEELRKARESYSVCDFIFEPTRTILELLFSWELKKDGYLKKAGQQKYLRPALILLILLFLFFIVR